MKFFRTLLFIMIANIIIYTTIVGINHGWNLFPPFLDDISKMNWPGQFNMDFTSFLALSGLWLAWRNHFSIKGIILGVLGFFGGIMVLAPYLLWTSFKSNGDMKIILLGETRDKD